MKVAKKGMVKMAKVAPKAKPGICGIELKWDEAVRIAQACGHCMSKEDTRYYLKGVCLQYSVGEGLLAIATDGHRLARCKVNHTNIESKGGITINCILPRDAVEHLAKLKESGEQMVTLTLDEAALCCSIEYCNSKTNFKLIDGHYPDWKSLWDKACKQARKEPTAFFNVHYMNDIAKAVKALKGEKNTRIGLIFHAKNPREEAVIVETPDTGVHYILMPMR